jgi:hypothetical protein
MFRAWLIPTKEENMATANVNGIRLFYKLSGTGEIPLVLVHGSWVSHHDGDLVVPGLADSYCYVSLPEIILKDFTMQIIS